MTSDEDRPQPPTTGDEVATLVGYLELHRDTLRRKAGGLDAAQLRATLPPSDLTLGGMVKHLAFVEDWWFGRVLRDQLGEPWASVDWQADPDWDWHSAADDAPDELWALWEAAVERSRAALAEDADPERRAVHPPGWTGGELSLRWVLVHMVEEYARHNGHADLIRQSIDGSVGE